MDYTKFYIRVVKITEKGPKSDILLKGEYNINSSYQIILPPNYYSSGYYERMTDSNWDDLPRIYHVSNLKILCMNKVLNWLSSSNQDDIKLKKPHLSILPNNLRKYVLDE